MLRRSQLKIALALVTALASALCTGCASIPMEAAPEEGCNDAPAPGERAPRPEYCEQAHLVIGLFPSVGEFHLNEVSTKGMRLTPMRRWLDYTVVPGIIAYQNIGSLFMPTAYGFYHEPWTDYDQYPGACEGVLFGFCKAALSVPRPGERPDFESMEEEYEEEVDEERDEE